MLGIEVNPAAVQKGDSIAYKYKERYNPETEHTDIIVTPGGTRKIKDVRFCPTQPEMFHLDGECYDTRYSTVVRVVG